MSYIEYLNQNPNFVTLFVIPPTLGFAQPSGPFDYHEDANDLVRRNRHVLANVIKIASALPGIGCGIGICHLIAAANPNIPVERSDKLFYLGVYEISLSAHSMFLGASSLWMLGNFFLNLHSNSEGILPHISSKKILPILNHFDGTIPEQRETLIRIFSCLKSDTDLGAFCKGDKDLKQNLFIKAFPYLPASLQYSAIHSLESASLEILVDLYKNDVETSVILSQILLAKGLSPYFERLYTHLESNPETLSKFLQKAQHHSSVLNYILEHKHVDSNIAEQLKLIPFLPSSAIREHFESEEMGDFESTAKIVKQGLFLIESDLPHEGIPLITAIPFEELGRFIKKIDLKDVNTLYKLLDALPDHYYKLILSLIYEYSAVQYILLKKGGAAVYIKNAPLDVKEYLLIEGLTPESYVNNPKEANLQLEKAFLTGETSEKLEKDVADFFCKVNELIEAKRLQATQISDQTPEEFLDALTFEVMETPVKLPETDGYVDDQTLNQLEVKYEKGCKQIKNPFNRNFYDASRFLHDLDLQQRLDAWKKRREESTAN